MKQQADKHWSERSFDVGDMVFLRLIPYQHESLPKHYFHKLQPKFYGPFKVLAKVGSVANKIDLRSTSKLHPLFHHLLLDETIEFWNCSCSTIARGNRGGYFGRLSHCHFATEWSVMVLPLSLRFWYTGSIIQRKMPFGKIMQHSNRGFLHFNLEDKVHFEGWCNDRILLILLMVQRICLLIARCLIPIGSMFVS